MHHFLVYGDGSVAHLSAEEKILLTYFSNTEDIQQKICYIFLNIYIYILVNLFQVV